MSAATRGPRERMVFSAAQLIRRSGVAQTGMRDVAAHAQAPRGSLQHYFPGGKDQLVTEAVEWAGRYAARRIEQFLSGMADPTPGRLLAAMAGQWIAEFRADGYQAGCPVAAVTVDCAATTEAVRDSAAAAFRAWRSPVADALRDMGVPADKAPALATLMISAVEGAILMSRSERSVQALQDVTAELGPLLDQHARAGRTSGPTAGGPAPSRRRRG